MLKSIGVSSEKDLFKDIDLDTKFFVASMTDPSVTNFLIEIKANIWGCHAFTDSLIYLN